MRVRTLACVLIAFAPSAAVAADAVDLQLVLAVDVSRSMDVAEQRLQRDGYVSAFRSTEVEKAIESGAYGRIAVTYIEWSSAYYQRMVVPWTLIANDEDALVFADELARAPLGMDNRTSISGGLLYAAGLFATSGFESDRLTIDVSGDGPNNDGQPLQPVRLRVAKQGININGLPILLNPTPTFGPLGAVSLADYYRDCVIGGPNAFVIPIRSLDDFASATRSKLVLEIAAVSPQVVPVLEVLPATPKVDCLLAERLGQGGGFGP